jgi:hypothetical protein
MISGAAATTLGPPTCGAINERKRPRIQSDRLHLRLAQSKNLVEQARVAGGDARQRLVSIGFYDSHVSLPSERHEARLRSESHYRSIAHRRLNRNG